MAVSELPQRSGVDLQGVSSLANLFLGKTTNTQNGGGVSTTGTRTVSESVDPAAVKATVDSILSGTQGLAAVSSGQRRAGLYNSSTNQLLTNDLMARTAAEASKLNKSTTTRINENQADNRTITQQQQAPISGSTAGAGAAILGGLSLLPPEVKRGILSRIGVNTGGPAAAIGSTESAVTDFMSRHGETDSFAANPNQVVTSTQSVAPMAVAGSSVMDSAGDIAGLSGVEGNFDLFGGSDGYGGDTFDGFSGFMDFSGGGDYGFTDLGASGDDLSSFYDMGPALDVGSDWASIDWGVEDLGAFFAEGGLVSKNSYTHDERGRRNMYSDPRSTKYHPAFNRDDGYAEGGEVRKDYPEGGTLPAVTVRAKRLPASAPRNYAEGGLVNRHKQLEEQEAAIVRGDDPNKKAETKAEPKQEAPAQRSNAARIGDMINSILGRRRPGYAEGGPVNVGLRARANTLRDPNAVASNSQYVDNSASRMIGQRGTVATNQSTRGGAAGASPRRRVGTDLSIPGSGDAVSTPDAVGTPTSNESAVAGLGLGIVGAMTATPLGLAAAIANNLGLTNINTLSPIAAIVQALVNSNSSAGGDENDGLPEGHVTVDPLTPDTSTGNDGTDGMGDAPAGSVSVGAGVGDSGDSSGVGDGGVGPGGTGGDGWKTGGEIDGPGTETSDSIPINVSDGEFVVNAAATKMFLPIIEQMNNMGRMQMRKQGFKPQNRSAR